MVTHGVQRLGKSGDVVGRIESETRGAFEKVEGKAEEVKGEVQKRL